MLLDRTQFNKEESTQRWIYFSAISKLVSSTFLMLMVLLAKGIVILWRGI